MNFEAMVDGLQSGRMTREALLAVLADASPWATACFIVEANKRSAHIWNNYETEKLAIDLFNFIQDRIEQRRSPLARELSRELSGHRSNNE